MDIQVKPHQCLLHQSILLTQGPNSWSFKNIYWKLAKLKNSFFVNQPLFFSKKIFSLITMKISRYLLCSKNGGDFAKFCGLLRIYELYSKRLSVRNNLLQSVSFPVWYIKILRILKWSTYNFHMFSF